MKFRGFGALVLVLSVSAGAGDAQSLKETNAAMLRKLQRVHGLDDRAIGKISTILKRSGRAGQGNPAVTRHPLSEAACRARGGTPRAGNPRFEKICGAKNMAPLYDPRTQQPEDAKSCIDQFEFPNLTCTFPVVWIKASEAAAVCEAEGKQLCDADQWENACQGAATPPDYRFDLAKGVDAATAVSRMRAAHNSKYASTKRRSYGKDYKPGICGANSTKSPGCNGGDFARCGSNTYPAGSFKKCVSPLGVYDLNGNAAEIMNLPLAPDQMASKGSRKLGVTELKGSWFIFDKYRAHPDWCKWRAPFWHGTRVRSDASHANYHLGFRCCKTLN